MKTKGKQATSEQVETAEILTIALPRGRIQRVAK